MEHLKLGKRHLATGMLVLCMLLVASYGHSYGARSSRLSGTVAFAPETPITANFLSRPGVGYVKAYLRFGPDMADDVIMFIDQEMLEGLANHRWVKGGDWMALVGFQRSGAVWVAGGTATAREGTPSRDRNWKIHDLKHRLEPDIWYEVEVVADFGKRKFISFSIEGGTLKRTINLSDIDLDYPNHMPFDRASMIYIIGAMRGRGMMTREGEPILYFDDVEGGIVLADKTKKRLFFNDLESQNIVARQPVTGTPILLNNYKFNHWYLERDESLIRIEKAPFARSGQHVGVADANLSD